MTAEARRCRLKAGEGSLILFNKPFGVLSQFSGASSPHRRETLAGWIDHADVYPVGRLDKDSEGLLLLTDDGRLQSRIAEPRYKLAKTYLVQVEGEPTEDDLEKLRCGVTLKDGPTLPAKVDRVDPPGLRPRHPPVRFRKSVADRWLRLSLWEGRNRQIRRMTAAIGHPTLRLVRWQVGPWTVAGIVPGALRSIDAGAAWSDLMRAKRIEHWSDPADKGTS